MGAGDGAARRILVAACGRKFLRRAQANSGTPVVGGRNADHFREHAARGDHRYDGNAEARGHRGHVAQIRFEYRRQSVRRFQDRSVLLSRVRPLVFRARARGAMDVRDGNPSCGFRAHSPE